MSDWDPGIPQVFNNPVHRVNAEVLVAGLPYSSRVVVWWLGFRNEGGTKV